VTSAVAVFEAVIREKINVCDNIVTENQKKNRKHRNLRIWHISPPKRWFRM